MKIKIILAIILGLFLGLAMGERESRLVYTSQGPVRGYKSYGDDVYVFHDVPYATTPTGPNKFRAPLPPPTWDEPFDAVQRNILCPQVPSGDQYSEMNIQEDCLIANIYVPETEQLNLPVLIHFHGGAFLRGFGSMRTPINLVKSKKIIAVNFNYRVGAHGFLCLGTENAPGNAGLKDQVALLRWVQRNIASFGGNANDITISGCSAGATSIDLMVLSPITRGLFHKVIPESASGIAAIAFQMNPLENAKTIANQLSPNHGSNIRDLDELFKNTSITDLINVKANSLTTVTLMSPCIERDVGEEMVIGQNALDILRKGDFPKLPTLYGIADKEGKYRVNMFDTLKYMMNDNFSDFLPQDLGFANEDEKIKVSLEVKQFYFGNESVSESNILSFVDYFTDTMFAYGVARAANILSEVGNDNVYLYEYNFVADNEEYIPHTDVRGATHCAQNNAVFDNILSEENLSQENKNMKVIMRNLWLNFITKGVPVPEGSSYPEWHPINGNQSVYMLLNISSALKPQFLGQRTRFWDKIYDKYYKAPIPPST